MPHTTHLLGAALGTLVLAGGCDTLSARQKANDAAGAYKKGKIKEAAETYEAAAQLDPKLATIQLNLGFSYLSLVRDEVDAEKKKAYGGQAIEAFKRYMALNPEDSRGQSYLVQSFIDSKRYEDAQAFFKPQIEQAQPSIEAITLLSEIGAKLGRMDDALELCQRRAELKPNDPEAHQALGALIWNHLHNRKDITGQGRVDLADRGIKALEHALELKPGALESLTYLNLTFRERAYAHPCESWDAAFPDAASTKRPKKGPIPDAGELDAGLFDPSLEACEAARTEDLKQAEHYFSQAKEAMKRALQQDGGVPFGKPVDAGRKE